jgi:hypothetical protein
VALGLGAGVAVGVCGVVVWVAAVLAEFGAWLAGVVAELAVWSKAGVELADQRSGDASGSSPRPQAVHASATSNGAVRRTMVTIATPLS